MTKKPLLQPLSPVLKRKKPLKSKHRVTILHSKLMIQVLRQMLSRSLMLLNLAKIRKKPLLQPLSPVPKRKKPLKSKRRVTILHSKKMIQVLRQMPSRRLTLLSLTKIRKKPPLLPLSLAPKRKKPLKSKHRVTILHSKKMIQVLRQRPSRNLMKLSLAKIRKKQRSLVPLQELKRKSYNKKETISHETNHGEFAA